MAHIKFLRHVRCAVVVALLLSSSLVFAEGKQPLGDQPTKQKFDRYESVNRKIFGFNNFLDKWLLKPVAQGYRWITPGFVDNSVSRVFANLGEIRNLLNAGLQGDLRQAGTSSGRFLVNSTLGIAGILDVASGFGLEERREDFGQTLAVWGVGSGPHIVVPFLGSRTLRDALSMFPDNYMIPTSYIEEVSVRNSVRGLDLVDGRADLISSESLIIGDRYTFLRDVYLQQRESKIANGELEALSDDFEDDF